MKILDLIFYSAFIFSFLQLFFFPCGPVYAKTIVLAGALESKIAVTQQAHFSVGKPIPRFEYTFALPASFSNKAVHQDLQNLNITFSPVPAKVSDETDAFGNHFKRALWNDLNKDVQVVITFQASIRSELSDMQSKAPFPLRATPQNETVFLKSTEMVQSGSVEISSLAKKLTARANTEYEAVTAIMNYVSDNIKYAYNPPQYDALFTLNAKSGNCQNFAHISLALLRAAGIPARIVGGISLKEPWKIPVNNSAYVVQSMGQGGHAWMEVYFSDLGWLSYDPQQSKQFTSSRHIKQTNGLDSSDINDMWRGTPYVPEYSELIDAKFIDDSIVLKMKSSDTAPKAYLLSNNLIAKTEGLPLEKPPVELPNPQGPTIKPVPKETIPKPVRGKLVELGNMAFPNLVDLFKVTGDKGVKIFDKETAEYVTSRYLYAQAFGLEWPVKIKTVSLAMRKFGGDGTVYIDVVSDDNGKPGLSGVRSKPVFLENVKQKPGYYWVDFTFPNDATAILNKGKFWIVLRHSGETIMNWFYIPGKHYGESDDTRSTLKGYKWEDIQNYDFVFRVKGIVE